MSTDKRNDSSAIPSSAIQEISSKSKCDIVVDKIVELIAMGEYLPGEKLPSESFFTESFGVSRVTIRESFKKLSSMGVVNIKQGHGTFVNKIAPSTFMMQLYPLLMLNEQDVEQLYETRIYLESGIAELAALHRSPDDLRQMRDVVAGMQECVSRSDFEAYNCLDLEFHALIGEASKNEILLSIYKLLEKVRKRGIDLINATSGVLPESIDAHEKIFHAIEAQDCAQSRELMRQHIAFSQSVAVRVLAEKSK